MPGSTQGLEQGVTLMQKQNINQAVWKVLQKDLAVQKGLARKIVNVRALAKQLIREHQLRASLDSVISAIRRFQAQEMFEQEDRALTRVFQDAVISTRNNIACVTVGLRPVEFFGKVCTMNGALFPFKVASGSEEFKILVDQPHLDALRGLFAKKDILSVEKDLSELSVIVAEKATQTKGVMARIANELSLANINIHELIVCPPEFLIYVKERDIVKSHEAVLKLCEGRE